MTRTMIFSLQSVGFGKKVAMTLSLSLLELEDNSHQKSLGNPNP